VTLEAFLCKKPVITCTDSGGIDILVRDGTTGWIAEPEPKALAEAMDRMFRDKQQAKRMGEAGYDLVETLKITWDNVIEKLTK
jgi:glycosyltransferase involved in cell wall biosynthesis